MGSSGLLLRDSVSPVVLLDNLDEAIDITHTLSDSAANYRRLLIEYKDNVSAGQCGSVIVDDPDGKRVSLHSMICYQASYWLMSRAVIINGLKIETAKTDAGFTQVGTWELQSAKKTHEDCIAVIKVLGWPKA